MGRVRQLPVMYLRGALANETMKNLDDEQQREVARITDEIVTHPVLAGHKHMFTTQLSNTIGFDYSDDRASAMQDFYIAIWRATVHLKYHSSYQYECGACSSNSYLSAEGRPVAINRRLPVCPHCKKVRINNPGSSKEWIVGSFVTLDEAMATSDVSFESPITALASPNKVDDPDRILTDPDQIKKYYGQFIWNYFRQIIRENIIRTQGRKQQTHVGPVDKLIALALAAILKTHNVEYQYIPEENPSNGYYRIYCNPNLTPLNVTSEIIELLQSAGQSVSVLVGFDHKEIRVKDMRADAPCVELDVPYAEPVFIVDKTSPSCDEEALLAVDQVAETDIYDVSDCINIEYDDWLATARDTLPNGHCQVVFDLLAGRGESYLAFLDDYPDSAYGVPKRSHIAQFIGCSSKDVKRHQEVIKHAILASTS